MDADTEARVRELAREEIRAAAKPPAPVQPVAPRELTPAEVEECARAGWEAVPSSGSDGAGWTGYGVDREWWTRLARWTMRQEPGALGFGAFDYAVLAKAAEIRARPPAEPQPAPSEDRDTSLAYACGAVAAAAVAIVDPTQPSDVVFRVVRDALAANGATQPAPDSWHDAAAWIEAWGPSVTEQPAPSATVDEVMAAVKPSWEGAVDRLRRALSALSPAQLRGMVDAIGGAK